MSAHPHIDALLVLCDRTPAWRYLANDPEANMGLLATELRALLAEREALQAKRIELECAIDTISAQSVREANIADQWRAKCEKAEAEREALQAKATPPTRKLREYKGVTYEAGAFRVVRGGKKWAFQTVAALIASFYNSFTDADHAAIYALKDDPYLPVETVEDIVRELAARTLRQPDEAIADYVTRLRAAVLAEPTRGEG